jgi:hypothetical protein
MMVESKSGLGNIEAKFEFKWIPKLGKLTGRQLRDEKAMAVRGIETRNLRAAIIGALVLLSATWIAWRSLKSLAISGR